MKVSECGSVWFRVPQWVTKIIKLEREIIFKRREEDYTLHFYSLHEDEII